MIPARTTRVVLAAAHLDHDPSHNRWRNLKSLCQRCHLLHDRPYHLAQRWITHRHRYAAGDLFLGFYRASHVTDDAVRGAPDEEIRSASVLDVMQAVIAQRSTAYMKQHRPAGVSGPVLLSRVSPPTLL